MVPTRRIALQAWARGGKLNRTFSLLDSLGKAIVTGQFDSQTFPTEADLACRHAVSRSVTSEAVKMLRAKGLLTARPRTGTIVQPPASWNLFDPDVLRWLLERKFSLELLRHFTELRIAIEPAAAALAAQAATEAEVAEIRLGYERMEAAEATHDGLLEADIAFHLAILRASGNPFYAQFQNTVSTALRTSIRFTNRLEARTASLPQHAAVIRTIEAREPDLAQQAMFKLINDVRALMTGPEGMN